MYVSRGIALGGCVCACGCACVCVCVCVCVCTSVLACERVRRYVGIIEPIDNYVWSASYLVNWLEVCLDVGCIYPDTGCTYVGSPP